ncbi:hypothetical protein SDJN02_07805, partial [Cucurbita argyrosperma subsp. argyrosperma]
MRRCASKNGDPKGGPHRLEEENSVSKDIGLRRVQVRTMVEEDASLMDSTISCCIACSFKSLADKERGCALQMPSPGHSGLLSKYFVFAKECSSERHIYARRRAHALDILLRIIGIDIVLLDEVFGCSSVEKHQTISENQAMLERAVHGFQCLREAIMLAPQVWTAMFIRVTSIPENGALPPRCPTLPEPYLEHVPMNTVFGCRHGDAGYLMSLPILAFAIVFFGYF